MEQKQKAVEQFINDMALIPPPSTTPTPIEGLKYLVGLMSIAEKLFDAGFSAGLTEKTIKDLDNK